MPTRLKRLRITRSDLVDKGANYDPLTGEGAHVLLYKRDDPVDGPDGLDTPDAIEDLPDDNHIPDAPEVDEDDTAVEGDEDDDDHGKPVEVADGEDADAYGKRDYTSEARDQMASSGEAMSGGRYPIKTVQDLKNAIQAYGRGSPADKPKIKAHIIRRAKALGQTDLIPESWSKAAPVDKMSDGMPEYGDTPAMPDDLLAAKRAREAYCEVHQAFMDSFYTIMNQAPASDQPKLLQQAVSQFAAQMRSITPDVRKYLDDPGQEALEVLDGITQGFAKVGAKISSARMKRLQAAMDALKAIMDEQQGDPAMQDTEKKAYEAQIDALKKRAETVETEKSAIETQLSTLQGEVTALKELVAKKEEPTPELVDDDKLWKGISPLVRKKFEDQEIVNKHLNEELKIEKERRERQEFVTLMKTAFDHLPMNPDDDWVTLRDIRNMPAKSAERVESLLRIANDFAKSSRQFVEIGRSPLPNGDGAQPGMRFMSLVNNEMANGNAKTVDEAMQVVNKMHPGLYAEYAAEQRRKARTGE